MPFDPVRFIEDCRAAMADAEPQRTVREVLTRAVREPREVLAALGAPERPGVRSLHRADDLTIVSGVFPANVVVPPHEHRMWAVIGIVSGREDNIYWRRIRDEGGSRIEAAGASRLIVCPFPVRTTPGVAKPLRQAPRNASGRNADNSM